MPKNDRGKRKHETDLPQGVVETRKKHKGEEYTYTPKAHSHWHNTLSGRNGALYLDPDANGNRPDPADFLQGNAQANQLGNPQHDLNMTDHINGLLENIRQMHHSAHKRCDPAIQKITHLVETTHKKTMASLEIDKLNLDNLGLIDTQKQQLLGQLFHASHHSGRIQHASEYTHCDGYTQALRESKVLAPEGYETALKLLFSRLEASYNRLSRVKALSLNLSQVYYPKLLQDLRAKPNLRQNLAKLNISNNSINEFPIAELDFPRLQILKINGNEIRELPARLPASLTTLEACDNLLSNSQKASRSTRSSRRSCLKHLDLSGNQFETWPNLLAQSNLNSLNLSGNPFSKINTQTDQEFKSQLPTCVKRLALGAGQADGSTDSETRLKLPGELLKRLGRAFSGEEKKRSQPSKYPALRRGQRARANLQIHGHNRHTLPNNGDSCDGSGETSDENMPLSNYRKHNRSAI